MTGRVRKMLREFNGRVSVTQHGRVYVGFDSPYPEADAVLDQLGSLDEPLSVEERKALAEEMIRRWKLYADNVR